MRPNVVETVPKVLICKVGPRDGLQSVTATMPTRMVKNLKRLLAQTLLHRS